MKKVLVAILCLVAFMSVLLGEFNIAHAQSASKEIDDKFDNMSAERIMSEEEIAKGITAIEKELSIKGKDVVTELEKQINDYQEKLKNTNDREQVTKIENIITTMQSLIEDYLKYAKREQAKGGYHPIYTPAVSSVIAGFSLFGYNLAAELLAYAVANNELDSIYVPINSDNVLSSSVYSDIKNGTTYEGSSSFPDSGDTNDKDLYYAIHSFYFSKSVSGRTIVIQDRYDYANNGYDGSLSGGMIGMMYAAQQVGVLVPYYSVITHNFEGTACNQSETATIYSSTRYYEDKVTLGKGEYKDYYVTFRTSGTKTFQTFGTKDTYMYLYDSNENLIKSSDDDGYNTNAFIAYECSAYTQYKVRVKFYSLDYSGETKLAITSSFGDLNEGSTYLNTYQDIYNTSYPYFVFYTYSTTGHVKLFRYTPTDKAYYTIETESEYDTFIYIIDPRATYKLKALIDFDDMSGDGYNARLNKELAKNIPYLIIYSKNRIMESGSNFILKINKSS